MSYTGNVAVGGAADTRELPGLTITKVAVGPMDNNAYLVRCTQTGELALIDAANDAITLLGLIGDRPLATIITTHQHWDHHAALREVQQATGAATVAHPEDAPGLPIPVTRRVQHGDTIDVGNARLSVIHRRLPVPWRSGQH
jgi:glyoxylase-like metal-dependent hydrolase (beta-lactamase superfamily II)